MHAPASFEVSLYILFLGYCASSSTPVLSPTHAYVHRSWLTRPVISSSTFPTPFFCISIAQWSHGCFQPSRAGPSFFARYINCAR